MKLSLKLLSTSISSLIALSFLAVAPSTVQAATQNWNNAGPTNTWSINAGDTNWLPLNNTWVNGNDANFTAAGETITIGTNLTVASISFGVASGAYTFNNGANTIDITGVGIQNSGVSAQTINSSGLINFNNASSAGNNTSITLSNSGGVTFNNTSSAGGANLSINSGQITFGGSSTAATSTINSGGIIEFVGASLGGTAAVSNGGTLDISGHNAGTVTLGSLNNSSGGSAGAVITGANKLQVGSLTLAPISGNLLDFTLFTATTSGQIIVGGPFVGAGAGQVTINITPGAPTLTSSVYDLIDWTGGTGSGVELSDFVLTSPASYTAGYTLRIDPNTGKKLQLVQSVPDSGNTFVLFGAVVLCMGFIAHRRHANA